MTESVATRNTQEDTLLTVLGAFQSASVRVKQSASETSQRKIDRMLDSLLQAQQMLQEATNISTPLVPILHEIFNADLGEDPKHLAIVRDIIVLAEALAGRMIRLYATLNRTLAPKGMARMELHAYKEMANDMKETAVDLNARYFTLPQDAEFQSLMTEFAALPPLSVE